MRTQNIKKMYYSFWSTKVADIRATILAKTESNSKIPFSVSDRRMSDVNKFKTLRGCSIKT